MATRLVCITTQLIIRSMELYVVLLVICEDCAMWIIVYTA